VASSCRAADIGRRSGSNRYLVNLIREVSGALVDSLNGLRAGRLGQAEHVPGLGVRPRLSEVDTFVALNVQVRLMRGPQLLRGDTDHAGVDIHKRCHVGTRFP
jgi:hypothetical protein